MVVVVVVGIAVVVVRRLGAVSAADSDSDVPLAVTRCAYQ